MIRIEEFRFPVPVKVQDDGCWIPECGTLGYYSALEFEGEVWYGHRLSFCKNIQEIPRRPPILDGDSKHSHKTGLVLHHCDIRKCVNPNHLYLGTQSDNVKDYYARNENAISSRIGNKNREGILHSPETKEQMSKSKMGNQNAKGHIRTQAMKDHQSKVMKGNKSALGHKHDAETRKKMSMKIKAALAAKKEREENARNRK